MDLWRVHGSKFKAAIKYWENHSCVKFRFKEWQDIPDLKFQRTFDLAHNRENMIMVITRYNCALGTHGTSCSAHVGSVCGRNYKGIMPCLTTCENGVPWKQPCHGWSDCTPQTKDVKCIGNTLTIGDVCEKEGPRLKTLIHEFGHALGLYHEMNRGDRNKYIQVLGDRLAPGSVDNFEIPWNVPETLDTPYDYLSIMHYSKYAFTRDRRCVTMRTTNKCAQDLIGKSERASYYDIKAVNTMYRCNIHCTEDDYKSWKSKGYGKCDNKAGCYLDRSCFCVCPEKWDDDPRYLPRNNPLYEHLPNDGDCRLGAPRMSTLSPTLLIFCAIISTVVHAF